MPKERRPADAVRMPNLEIGFLASANHAVFSGAGKGDLAVATEIGKGAGVHLRAEMCVPHDPLRPPVKYMVTD